MGEKRTIKTVLRGGTIFTAYSSNGHSINMDSDIAHGGMDAGASPMQMLLMGLSGCTGMDVISILRKKQQDVTGMEIQVSGIRADEPPKVYTDITVHFVITGHDIKPEAVERAMELSHTKYCGASAMLGKTATMTFTYEIHEAIIEGATS